MYLDIEQYEKQLDKLDPLTKMQLKEGDWDAVINEGLLANRVQLENQIIDAKDYQDWTPVFCTIGIDPASTGTDKFAMSCLVYFENGNIVLVDLEGTSSAQTDEFMKYFVERNTKWNPYVINFEGEGGSSPQYALKYWKQTLKKVSSEHGIVIKKTPASTMGSKYTRAMPHANLVRQGRLFFDRSLDINQGLYNPLKTLINQYIYVHPDKQVMEDYPSPDELDSVSYAFSEIQSVIQL